MDIHQLESGHGSSCNLKYMFHYTRAGSSTGSSGTLHGLIFCRKSQLRGKKFCLCALAMSLQLRFHLLAQYSDVFSPIFLW